MGKRLNFRLIVILACGLTAMGAGVHCLHYFQVRRALTREADRALEADRPDLALRHLGNYLRYVSDDIGALARYGLLLGQSEDPERRAAALAVLKKALHLDPARNDLERQIARWAVSLGDYNCARQHLEQLALAEPNDGEVEYLLGFCEEAQASADPSAGNLDAASIYAEARQWYARAIEHAPARLESYERLARVLRCEPGQSGRADQIMSRMVAANPQSFQAFLARGRYRREFGSAQAAEDIALAVSLAPDETAVLIAQAEIAADSGDEAQALTYLDRALEHSPRDGRLCRALAARQLRAGRLEAVVTSLSRGQNAAPPSRDWLWTLGEVLKDKADGAGELVAACQRAHYPQAQLDYLEACRLLGQEEWLAASVLLERAEPLLAAWPEAHRQAYLVLGECYGCLDDEDRQLEAYRQAVRLDPRRWAVRMKLAEALLAAGHAADSATEYRRAAVLPGAPAIAWIALAKSLLAEQLRLPMGQREWHEVQRVLTLADKIRPAAPDIALLRAEVLGAQNALDQAKCLLMKARAQEPQQELSWIASAALSQRAGEWQTALSILDTAEQQFGKRLAIQLARARYWAERGGPDAASALRNIERQRPPDSRADHRQLRHALAAAYQHLGLDRDADRIWLERAREEPGNVAVRLCLFDSACRRGDAEAIAQLCSDFERIQGPGGALCRWAKACRLVWRVQHGESKLMAEARAELTAVAQLRPSWPRVAALDADLALLEGKYVSAADSYLKAMQLGARSPLIARRALDLLCDQQRYEEANALIDRLTEEQATLPDDLRRLAADLALRVGQLPRGKQLAGVAAPPDSMDYRGQLWLGQVMARSAQLPEAEQALRKATLLEGAIPETWFALIQFLLANGQKQDARQALADARQKLPAPLGNLILAKCHELAGSREEAQALYCKALERDPNNPPIIRSVADFYLRAGQFRKAEPLLRKLAGGRGSEGDQAWARRRLACALADCGDYQEFLEALRLLEAGRASGAPRTEDLRAHALLLVTRKNHGCHRREAITLLEELGKRQPLAAGDRLLLAQLYDADSAWPAARAIFEDLLAAEDHDVTYLHCYALALLRHGQVADAENCLERLVQTEPRGARMLDIKLRLLLEQGRFLEAAAVLRVESRMSSSATSGAGQLPTALRLVLGLVDEKASNGADKSAAERAEWDREVEKLYRGSLPQHREVLPAFASWLGGQGRIAEALAVCEEMAGKCPPEMLATVAMTLLRARPADVARIEQVERLLIRAEKSTDGRRPLLVFAANLREFQERYDEAEKLYREAIGIDPKNVTGLNNLAWLLTMRSTSATEALALINRAIAITGPLPELLDTRAMVYLALGESGLALADLQQAIADGPTAAMQWHLAWIHQRAGDGTAMAQALERAQSMGLTPEVLHPLERQAYQSAQAEVKKR